VLEALPRLARAALQHLIAYGELLCEEGAEAGRRLRRSAIGLALAAAAGFIALELACLWIIAATWNGPNRLTAVGALCIGFAIIAVICSAYASGAQTAGGVKPFQRVRDEWRTDMQELAAFDPTLTGSREVAGTGDGHDTE
jgi:hypothetical protein